MRTQRFLNILHQSFYSKSLYREVGQYWDGFGFGYLLFLVSLVSVPVVVWLLVASFTVTLDKPFDANYIIDQIPVVTVENGALGIAEEQPYFIKDKDTSAPIAVIDTTKPVMDWAEPGRNLLVIGKKELLMLNSSKSEKRIYDITPEMDGVYTKDKIRMMAQKVVDWLWIWPLIFAPVIIVASFVYRMVQAYIYGLIGMAMARLMGIQLEYMACVRLAIVAITPVMVIATLAMLLPGAVPVIAYFLLAMFYLFYGIRANKL